MMVMGLNLHHLRIFYTLAKEKTTYQAANVLRISQPSVSAQIKQFEQSMGIALFEKQGRNIVLTHFGQLLLKYAEDLFGVEQEILFEIDKFKGRSTLHLTGHQLAIEQLINPMINRFKARQAHIEVSVSIKSTEESLHLLQSEQIDLAIIGLNPHLPFVLDASYARVRLLQDRLCFVVHAQADMPDAVTLEELSRFPFVGRLSNSYSQSLLDRLMEQYGDHRVQFDLRFENASAALEYALAHRTVIFSSYALVRPYIEQAVLKELRIISNVPISLIHDIYAVYKTSSHSRRFIEELLAHHENKVVK